MALEHFFEMIELQTTMVALLYKVKYYLEIQGIECVWIEIRLKGKRLLVGTFYRPSN